MSLWSIKTLVTNLRNIVATKAAKFPCLPSFIQSLKPYPSSTLVPTMDVQKSRFPIELVKIIRDVADSHFVAFDFEFSGVAGRRRPIDSAKLTLQQLYDDTREAAEKYQILQVGLTVVQEHVTKGGYIARPYNFNINPVPLIKERHFGREFSFHSGAVDFLLRNGFQFDRPFSHGIQYLSHKEEAEVRSNWIRDDEKRAEIPDMEIKKSDQPLVNHIQTILQAWQARNKEDRPQYQNIPAEGGARGIPQVLNRYQVRLTHQIVRKDFPALKSTGMNGFVQISNPTQEERDAEKNTLRRHRDREIAKAVGFRWLIDAIAGRDIGGLPDEYLFSALSSDANPGNGVATLKDLFQHLQTKLRTRRKVIVGHNCFTDLVYLYRCFIGDLPLKVEEFQEQIHEYFPAIIDTKCMASFGKKWNTSLEEVEQNLRTQVSPSVEIPAEFGRYQNNESYHEAGYDSLLTAKVAIKLSAKMLKDGTFNAEGTEPVASGPFGADDEEYASAAEELTTNDSTGQGSPNMLPKAFRAPLATIKSLLHAPQAPELSNHETSPGGENLPVAKPAHEHAGAPVVAIRQKSMDWSNPREIKAIKREFNSLNIYDVLRGSTNGSNDQAEDENMPDLMSFSSDEERTPDTKVSLGFGKFDGIDWEKMAAAMAKKGDMMPRWDGEDAFWRIFGNRLQVNGSQEGECRLVPDGGSTTS